MYTIKFFNTKGERYDFGQFFVPDDETFLDRLERVLYIMQGLTPVNNDWKRDLSMTGMATFTYNNLKQVTVFYDWDEDCTISVMDRDI